MKERPRSCGNAAPGDRFRQNNRGQHQPLGRGRRCPVALGDRAVMLALFCGGRVTGLCRLGRRALPPNAGLSGKGRSSSGRAAPLMRERCPPGTASVSTTEGGACPGWRVAPAPRRGRHRPVAWGDRAVRVGPSRGGRGDGPCRVRRCCRFPQRQAERERPVFQWKSGPAHAGTVPGGPSQHARTEGSACPWRREAPAPREGQALPGRLGRPGGAGGNGVWRQGRWPLPRESMQSCPLTSGSAEQADLPVEERPRSCGNAAPGSISTRTNRGQRLPRAARSASPREGQALPGRFGRPGGAGGTGAGRQGHVPLPAETGVTFPPASD